MEVETLRSIRALLRASRRWKAALGVTTLCALLLWGLAAPAASAESPQYAIAWTGIGIYPRSGPSMDAARVGAALPDGAVVSIACELEGQAVSNGYQVSTVWERLSDGTHLPNAFMDTGVDGWTPGVPRCDAPIPPPPVTPARVFDGTTAARWAVNNIAIPKKFDNDCAYFVSQALWAGGLPKSDEWTSSSSDPNKWASRWLNPGPTKAAANADYFKNYVVNSGVGTVKEVSWRDNTAGGAQLGDVIGYDWDNGADGRLDHLAIVTSLNEHGYPFVTQHSEARVDRYWSWNPGSVPEGWIEFTKPGSRVYLIHITK